MVDDLATLPELQSRLDWELDSGEQNVALGALADLSDDARFYGSSRWDGSNVPRQVKSLVLRAAARYLRNPDGFTQSRAGDETIQWSDAGENAGTAHFNKAEQKILGSIVGRGQGLVSVNTVAYGPTTRRTTRYVDPISNDIGGDDAIYVPSDVKPFPLFAEGEFA